MGDAVFPECYVDTNLTETIAPPVRRGAQQGYNHQKGCGTVAMKMQEHYGDRFALGIIDKDKHALDYLKEFTEAINAGSLILHRHTDPAKHHYIIQISPAIEQFILDSAASVNVSLEEFGLPSDFDHLKKVSKQKNSKSDTSFRNLFKAIHAKAAPQFQMLSGWVQYLRETTYKADIAELGGYNYPNNISVSSPRILCE